MNFPPLFNRTTFLLNKVRKHNGNNIYKDVPFKVLFWLRDLTRGKDERIFTVDENDDQVWW